MKKHTEKQPIDDLFARKLGNMSLPPSADGFERLQARMGQKKPEARIVFWRNPAVYGYMAAAACLLLVCLFGWLYWPSSGTNDKLIGTQLAVNKRVSPPNRSQSTANKPAQPGKKEAVADVPEPAHVEQSTQSVQVEQLAQNQPTGGYVNKNNRGKREAKAARSNRQLEASAEQPVLAQTKPTGNKTKVAEEIAQPAVQPTQPEPTVVAATKPVPVAERGLVVTIAEPEALVAAREVAKASVEEKTVVASGSKTEKETKSGNLWQQVKRLKQGEVFARGDNTENSESSLLGRAYSGLKHSIEKDKSAKQ